MEKLPVMALLLVIQIITPTKGFVGFQQHGEDYRFAKRAPPAKTAFSLSFKLETVKKFAFDEGFFAVGERIIVAAEQFRLKSAV